MGQVNKFEGFPTVNYISLHESVARRKYMDWQFSQYSIPKSNVYLAERWEKIKHNYTVIGEPQTLHIGHGTTTSHLNSLRNWYLNTTEEYGFFCDDDLDFSTSKYWSFTWQEFVNALPENWECVQLMRIDHNWDEASMRNNPNVYQLRMTYGRWWGIASIMRRSYVRKVLEAHILNFNTFNLSLINGEDPIIENVLFYNKGQVLNFPLFVEGLSVLDSTYRVYLENLTEKQYVDMRWWHTHANQYFLKLWEKEGANTSLNMLMGKE